MTRRATRKTTDLAQRNDFAGFECMAAMGRHHSWIRVGDVGNHKLFGSLT